MPDLTSFFASTSRLYGTESHLKLEEKKYVYMFTIYIFNKLSALLTLSVGTEIAIKNKRR